MLRTTSDITALRAFITVLSLLSREASELVVARGSFAVFAHAPSIARVPNDLDIYWFGQSDAVLPILEDLGAGPDVSVLQNRIITLPDDRIESLLRSDVLVWLHNSEPATHPMWVDISTNRRAEHSVELEVAAAPGLVFRARVTTLVEVIIEKLFVYLESLVRRRAYPRATDLVDMMVLLLGAPMLAKLQPHEIRAECVRYFNERGCAMPTQVPGAPASWAALWDEIIGSVGCDGIRIDRACEIAGNFWLPVFAATETECVPRLSWKAADCAWVDVGDGDTPPQPIGTEP
jgi:hypothetical protein